MDFIDNKEYGPDSPSSKLRSSRKKMFKCGTYFIDNENSNYKFKSLCRDECVMAQPEGQPIIYYSLQHGAPPEAYIYPD